MEEYELLLRNHDWYFEYSEDFRAWRKYADAQRRLWVLQHRLDKDYAIWNRYAPDDKKRKCETN